MRLLTAAEIGAFLGVTPSAVRQIVRRNGIRAKGKIGKAMLYDAEEVLGHAGVLDRRAPRQSPSHMSH